MPEVSAARPARPLVALSFESRRAAEMEKLLRQAGFEPVVAPSLREVPVESDPGALELLRRLREGKVDLLILLTGVGTRSLVRLLSRHATPDEIRLLFGRTLRVARGPKPTKALGELGTPPDLVVPEPNTWRELLALLDRSVPLRGKVVAVQEYGRPNQELLRALEERGAEVLPVRPYRWSLPEDLAPLREAVLRATGGGVDVALFTSAQQVENVLHVASELELEEPFRRAIASCCVGSVGPVCSEALREHGLPVDLEPPHPRMGVLVRLVGEKAREIVEKKRDRAAPG